MIKIAISGGLGSGKSEVINIIKSIHGPKNVGQLKFADPLYEIQSMVQNYLDLPLHKDRSLLQLLGTEWGRKKDPEIWIKLFLSKLDKLQNDVVICDDLRFCNEYQALKERGFILIKIDRSAKYRIEHAGTGEISHSSETDLPDDFEFDYYIENNSSYDDFAYVITEMFNDIKENKL